MFAWVLAKISPVLRDFYLQSMNYLPLSSCYSKKKKKMPPGMLLLGDIEPPGRAGRMVSSLPGRVELAKIASPY